MAGELDWLLGHGRKSPQTVEELLASYQEQADRETVDQETAADEFNATAPAGQHQIARSVGLSDVADREAALAEKEYAIEAADEERRRNDPRQKLIDFMNPQQQEQRRMVSDEAMRSEAGMARAKQAPITEGAIALEREKANQERSLMQEQARNTRELVSGGGPTGSGASSPGANTPAGAPGSWRPSINAKGQVSFQQTQMPALVQRAYAQLSDAKAETDSALQEAERLYPGAIKEVQRLSGEQGGGLMGSLKRTFGLVTGVGAPEYGGPTDRLAARVDRFNYSQGVASPFSKLAQSASFGNISQMAGQLPGVRGLATITPLFQEHQSRWGHETPLATVQRLLEMRNLMDQALDSMQSGGAAGAEDADIVEMLKQRIGQQ